MSTWTQTDNASDYAHKLTASMLHPGYHACIIPNICIVCSLLFNDKDLPIRVNLITWFHSSWPEVQTPHCTAEIFHLSTTIVDAALKPHLSSVLTPHQPQRSLRSVNQNLLSVPRCNSSFGQRSFSHCATKIWNDIPLSVRQSPSLDSFKHNLKTHYFANNWPPGDCLQRFWLDILDIVRSTNSYEWMNEITVYLDMFVRHWFLVLFLRQHLVSFRPHIQPHLISCLCFIQC